MALPVSIAEQLRSIDHQIIELLRERTGLCREAVESDEHAFDATAQAEILSDWQEAADEKGLSPTTMTMICKSILRLVKSEE